MSRPHKWYRIEMTATGQVYAREVSGPSGPDARVGSLAQWPLSNRDVGRYVCSCAVGYL